MASALLACLLAVSSCSGGKEHYPSPDGRKVVVIESGRTVLEKLWTVTVRDKGLFGQSRSIGCFTDDDPDGGTPTAVSWPEANVVLIETTAGEPGVRIELNSDGSVGLIEQDATDLLAPCPYS